LCEADLRTTEEFALLPRLAFLEGVRRQRMIFEHSPSRIWVFCDRITFTHIEASRKGSGSSQSSFRADDAESI
jgi:hypothetical protein